MLIEPARIAFWEGLSFSALFACTLSCKLLRRRRFLLSLLMDRPSTPPSAAYQVSFHRAQLLLVSVVLSLMLLHEILYRIAWKGGAAILQVNRSPVAVFAASAAVYVAGELHRALKQ